jgi:hypothetical protein
MVGRRAKFLFHFEMADDAGPPFPFSSRAVSCEVVVIAVMGQVAKR